MKHAWTLLGLLLLATAAPALLTLPAEAHCTANLGNCGRKGHCDVNLGECNGHCPVNLGRCDGSTGCPRQDAHSYGRGGAGGWHSRGVREGSRDVTVWDTNAGSCAGAPGGFDGDYDAGAGGAFFGYGPWANEDACGYDLHDGGGTVTVIDDLLGTGVAFVTAENDANGPTLIATPDGSVHCETDGQIAPGVDADDCVSALHTGTATACGSGGGDGGFWVVLREPHTTGVIERS